MHRNRIHWLSLGWTGLAVIAVPVRWGCAQLSFTDATDSAGLVATHKPHPSLFSSPINVAGMLGGGAVGDFDNDGWQDIFYLSGGVEPDRLFINNGDGTFTDQAAAFGVDRTHMGVGIAVGDYNNDGWLDVFITSFGSTSPQVGKHILYRNNGDGSFTDVAAQAGVHTTSTNFPDGFGAAWGDYDLDGDLDLYVTGWVLPANGNRLFRNNGDGTFTDVTVEAGLNNQFIRGFAPRLADMNGDGYPELLIAADFGTSRYYVNKGDGTFTNATQASGTGLDDNGMGQTVNDFNNDGRIDWYVTSIYSKDSGMAHVPGTGNMLYMGVDEHLYTEQAAEAGVDDGAWGWGTVSVDFDHNGWVDIAETNGWGQNNGYGEPEWDNVPAFLFLNNGTGSFDDQALQCGFIHDGAGRGLINVDADNDGRQDVLVFSFNEPFLFFHNELVGEHVNWLRVFLDTSESPRLAPNGFGARVSATAGANTMTRIIAGGDNYLSQSELSAHFGLADATHLDTLRIEWNDGTATVLHDVPANQTITIDAAFKCDLWPDGIVDGADLAVLLAQWGDAAATTDAPADLNADGIVDADDLGILLNNWGTESGSVTAGAAKPTRHARR